jgi:hypothetical protein
MELDTPSPHDAIADDSPIWRYMDLPRFVSMLATRELWFTKAATYDDPYEGFCKAVPSPDLGHGTDVKGQTTAAEMVARFARNAAEVCSNARDHLYVNSWCLEFESMAMWEIYGSRGYGVAVKSSVNRYRLAAKFDIRPEQYTFGKVEYPDDLELSLEIQRDFRSGTIPVGSGLWPEVLKLGFNKRLAYKYENEWRAALYQDPRPEIQWRWHPFRSGAADRRRLRRP